MNWLVIDNTSNTVTDVIVGDENTPSSFPENTLVDASTTSPAGAWIDWTYDPTAHTFTAPYVPPVVNWFLMSAGVVSNLVSGDDTGPDPAWTGTYDDSARQDAAVPADAYVGWTYNGNNSYTAPA